MASGIRQFLIMFFSSLRQTELKGSLPKPRPLGMGFPGLNDTRLHRSELSDADYIARPSVG